MTLDSLVFFGLYSYLRQLELSLDRVLLEGSTENLVKYFNSAKYNPETVINYFTKLSDYNENFLFIDSLSGCSTFKLFFRKKYILLLNDLLKLIYLIDDYNKIITSKEFNIDNLITMRMRLSFTNELFIGSKINKTCKKRLNNVEHYNQSKYLLLSSIDKILGKDWIY